MSRRILFVDRDGCLIEEPADQQIDSYEKLALMPNVIPALRRCIANGYELVMVSNQDGLGSEEFPEPAFHGPQNLLLQILESQGIRFREVLIDRSWPHDNADTRKPETGLVRHYLAADDWSRAQSAVVGDRDSDMQFAANLGVRGLRIGNGTGWLEIAQMLCESPRIADLERATAETRIKVRVNLDTPAEPRVATGIGYFDHMLQQLGKHGGFALELECRGDLHVDEHHTVEDCALALGSAIRQAVGSKRGIGRYGFTLPMDESLADAALDLSGRAGFFFDGTFPREQVGELPTELVPHFFGSLSDAMQATLHLKVRGENAHHMVEACFKAVARCLRDALRRDGDLVPSTKGSL